MTINFCVLTQDVQRYAQSSLSITLSVAAVKHGRLLTLYQEYDSLKPYDNFGWRYWHYYCAYNMGCAGGRKFLTEQLLTMDPQPDDIFVYLDDDVTIDTDDWLEKLILPLSQGSDICGSSGRIITPEYQTKECLPGERPHYISGGRCAIRAEVFMSGKVQFDEGFQFNYWEDADLCAQALQAGYSLAICADNGLGHSVQPRSLSAEAIERFRRNQERFRTKWPVFGASRSV